MRRLFLINVLLSILFLGGCTGNQAHPLSTSLPTNLPILPATPATKSTQPPLVTSTHYIPSTPTITPTPVGGGNGKVLVSQLVPGELIPLQDDTTTYYVSYDLILLDMNNPPGKVLISKSQIEDVVNKQLLSVEFELSPDLKNTVIYACTKHDMSHGWSQIYDVYIASLDLKSIVLIQTNVEFSHWTWSPDGTKLANYVDDPELGIYILRVINSDGSEYNSDLGKWRVELEDPSWLSDSSRLSFIQVYEVVELNLVDPDNYKRYKVGPLSGNLQYSPNGLKVAFLAEPPFSPTSFGRSKLIVANVDFSNPLTIIEENDNYDLPTVLNWSPDSQYVVIHYHCGAKTSCVRDETDDGEAELIVKVENGEIISINKPIENIKRFCGWSPDNKFVYILSDEIGKRYLSLVDLSQLDSPESGFRIDSWEGLECPVWLP